MLRLCGPMIVICELGEATALSRVWCPLPQQGVVTPPFACTDSPQGSCVGHIQVLHFQTSYNLLLSVLSPLLVDTSSPKPITLSFDDNSFTLEVPVSGYLPLRMFYLLLPQRFLQNHMLPRSATSTIF